ncbi:MAG: bifunctional nuclease family protein [Candidatus Pacearchaeota archaeon]|nr:bifunctional nuclease family protein [Candidatus Pacearchaeota archaeon]
MISFKYKISKANTHKRNDKKGKKLFKKSIFILILIFFVFFAGIFLGFLIFEKEFEFPFYIFSRDVEEASVSIEDQNLILKVGCRALFMTITQDQALSIKAALENVTPYRPLTHDILMNILREYEVEILHAVVHDSRDGVYLAKLFLRRKNKILCLDARPSDAVAIALRANSKIYVKKNLIEKAEEIC